MTTLPSPDETDGLANSATIDALLSGCKLPAVEARCLLGHVLGEVSTAWLIAHGDEIPSPLERQAFTQLVATRQAGTPIAYLLGEREFYGRVFHVTPAVLIPRPETEHLIEWCLARLALQAPQQVLELGAGSGIVAITLACERPLIKITATDISAAALSVAQRNAARWNASVRWLQGNWFEALNVQVFEQDLTCETAQHAPTIHPAQFDLIVSNPPYLAINDVHLQQGDLRFEPRLALSDEADGLSALRHIVAQARRYLQPAGWLGVEHGFDQGEAVRQAFAQAGFEQINTWADWSGHSRVTGGRAPVVEGLLSVRTS